MTERQELINYLKDTINDAHGSSLKLEQVETWLGSDTSIVEISDLIVEIKVSGGQEGVTPNDIEELCE